MSTALQFDTHEIFNQSPPYEDVDLFSTDAPLMDAVKGRIDALRAADPGNAAPAPVDRGQQQGRDPAVIPGSDAQAQDKAPQRTH